MKILFLGDVVGRSGRSAVLNHLPSLIKKNNIDFTVINAENATSGMGLNVKHAKELLDVGANCITLSVIQLAPTSNTVSYTHLTLPTILLV